MQTYHVTLQVVKNAKTLCSGLQKAGYNIATGGTDVHLVLVDLRNTGLSGAKAEFVLEEMHIACNKNTGIVKTLGLSTSHLFVTTIYKCYNLISFFCLVPGDKSALNPSGIRLGTPALTTRGLVEKDMEKVVDLIHRGM